MSCGLQLEKSVVSIAVGAWYCGLLECALWTTTRDKCSQYSCWCMVLWSITVSCGLQLKTSVVSIAVGAWYCGLLQYLVDYNSRKV